jgi:hypothetical protein
MIGADCGDPNIAASFLLQAALRANSSGVVLFSTTSPSHLRSAIASFERSYSSDSTALDAFLTLVEAELHDVADSKEDSH